MNSYRHISLWENSRRLRVLEEFRNDVVSYFNNSSPLGIGEGRREGTEAVQARQRINLTVDQAHRIIIEADIAPTVTWTPPPMFGGSAQRIYLILNLFELDYYQISAKHAVAFIERAIGVYQSDRRAALRRTINPLWWLFRGLLWFARIPFVVLGAVGFDAARMERSVLGKFFKAIISAIITLVGMAAALLTIFNEPGWWTAAKALLGIE